MLLSGSISLAAPEKNLACWSRVSDLITLHVVVQLFLQGLSLALLPEKCLCFAAFLLDDHLKRSVAHSVMHHCLLLVGYFLPTKLSLLLCQRIFKDRWLT